MVNILLFGAVMKRTALALLVTAVFLISLTATNRPAVEVAKANPYTPPVIAVLSPTNNTAYNAASVNFSFVVETLDSYDYYYSLDKLVEMKQVEVELFSSRRTESGRTMKTLQFSTEFHELGEGQHNLTVHHQYDNWAFPDVRVVKDDATIIFYVDTAAPKITNLSVNDTDSGDRLLSFTLDAETSWVGYSLDNQANVTVTDEAVLGDLPFGSHNVTVYAEDAAGNEGASETLYFTIEEPEPTPSPVPLVLASTGAISAVGVVLLYFKKRKH